MPCLHHCSTHLALWTTSASGLFYCCIVTEMLFNQYIVWWKIYDALDREGCKSRLAPITTLNVDKLDVSTSMKSDLLISSGNVTVAIILNLLITLLMRGTKLSNELSDTTSSYTGSFLHISAFSKRGFELTICSRILILVLVWNRCICHYNISRK